jgi:hypothetical protein
MKKPVNLLILKDETNAYDSMMVPNLLDLSQILMRLGTSHGLAEH